MTKPNPLRTLAGLLVPCLMIAACATADRSATKRASAESRAALEAGDSKEALDRYARAYAENPRNKELAAGYVRAIEEIKRAADQALGRKEYGGASNTYGHLLDHYEGLGPLAEGLSFDKAALQTALKTSRAALVDLQVQRDLKEGAFAKALKLRADAVKADPRDAGLAAKYQETVIAIKVRGDKALDEKDFARAGAANALLLNQAATIEALRPPVGFTRDALKNTVSICRENLTGAGLEEYRKGNLAKAIAIWESLLAFDPDNAEIQKAVTTARTQLDALKKKE